MNNEEEARQLIGKYLNRECTEEEKSLIERYYLDQFKQGNPPEELPSDGLKASMWTQVSEATQHKKGRLVTLRWRRVAAAMAFFSLVGATVFFLAQNQFFGPSPEIAYKNDVAPGGNNASLTLADGRRIELSSEKEGIALDAGTLTYTDGTELEKKLADYATLATPRGGQYQIVLPDGSKVWLNAASSLKYPTSFDGLEERRVELSGEGYFEVAHNQSMPFIVATDRQEIKVLGTHFNVQAYKDEPLARTTLLEGSVKVSGKGGDETLKPGEQVVLSGGEMNIHEVTVEDAVAWKNGYFMFNSETLESIMLKIGRWYDVEIAYMDPSLKHRTFFGSISRYENISKVLEMLEATDVARFEVSGNKVTIHKK